MLAQGSLFDEKCNGWNIRNLNTLLSRTLDAKEVFIPGVTTPYLYFGMWRSTFAWHTEVTSNPKLSPASLELFMILRVRSREGVVGTGVVSMGWAAVYSWFRTPETHVNMVQGVECTCHSICKDSGRDIVLHVASHFP